MNERLELSTMRSNRLHFRLPSFAIFPFPVMHRRVITDYFLRFGIEINGAAGAISDVAQVTQQGALRALGNFRIQFLLTANAIKKIGKVRFVIPVAFDFRENLALGIKDFVAVARDDERAVL